jgi:hypothetical protein
MPIISEASRMNVDLRSLPAFFASPRLRGEDDVRNARRARARRKTEGRRLGGYNNNKQKLKNIDEEIIEKKKKNNRG